MSGNEHVYNLSFTVPEDKAFVEYIYNIWKCSWSMREDMREDFVLIMNNSIHRLFASYWAIQFYYIIVDIEQDDMPSSGETILTLKWTTTLTALWIM